MRTGPDPKRDPKPTLVGEEILKPGDQIVQTHGPFESVWDVMFVNEIGAVLAYAGRVKFVGYTHPIDAPNGVKLTSSPRQDFLGRAHWHSARRA